MKKTYSLYEAKAKFSEILRRVRERGETVTVSYHGEPVAEIRPVPSPEGTAFERRLQELSERGALVRRGEGTSMRLRPIGRKSGALERFLRDRGE